MRPQLLDAPRNAFPVSRPPRAWAEGATLSKVIGDGPATAFAAFLVIGQQQRPD